jgi:hypothetical protein
MTYFIPQTFTIEPVGQLCQLDGFQADAFGQMINLGGNWDTVHWPDNWTATTIDGKKSAQFEDTLL